MVTTAGCGVSRGALWGRIRQEAQSGRVSCEKGATHVGMTWGPTSPRGSFLSEYSLSLHTGPSYSSPLTVSGWRPLLCFLSLGVAAGARKAGAGNQSGARRRRSSLGERRVDLQPKATGAPQVPTCIPIPTSKVKKRHKNLQF